EPREERFQVVVDAVRAFNPDAPVEPRAVPSPDDSPEPAPASEPESAPPAYANGHSNANGANGTDVNGNGYLREQVVIGPQNRGAVAAPSGGKTGNGNGNAKHGRPEPEQTSPAPTGPPQLVRIDFPQSGDEQADATLLASLLDVIEGASPGLD